MLLFSSRKPGLICLVPALLGGTVKVQAQAALRADDVIQKAVACAQKAQAGKVNNAFTYTKVSVTEEMDSTGKVKEHSEKVYQVLFKSGLTQVKLVEVNGHQPAETDLRKQSDNEMTVNRLLGQSKSNAGDNRENF